MGKAHLAPFAPEIAAITPPFQKAGRLHGEGGATGDDPPMPEPLACCPHHGEGVNPGMAGKAAVLIGDEHGQEQRVHRLCLKGKAPVATLGLIGPQQQPVAVLHLLRDGLAEGEVKGRLAQHEGCKPAQNQREGQPCPEE